MKYLILLIISLSVLPSLKAQRPDTLLHLQQELPTNDAWWQWLGDDTLRLLIDKAMRNNYDLQNAIKNIGIARSRLRVQRGSYFPTLTAASQYAPEKSSLGIDHTEIYSHIGQATLEMNWEIDVFGSIRKNVKAQKEYYLASQEDYRGVMVSLAAEVATAYIQLRTYQKLLEVAHHNLQSQEDILKLNEAKFEAGLASKLAVAQSRGLWLQTKATLPGLEASINEQANTLAVLTGEFSDSLRQMLLTDRPLPEGTAIPVEGIPTELIRRRPDIRSSERQMDALAAAAGASRADWWPKFYVNGVFGFGNDYYKHFFRRKNMTWQISPSVQWTIFSGRKQVETTRIARLQLDEGINNYNQTLLTALQEVDNAIVSYNKSLQQLEANRQALEQIRLTLEYAMDLYQKGLADYLTVLDSQRNVVTYENTLVNTQSASLLYLVQLYRALGGGSPTAPLDKEKLNKEIKEKSQPLTSPVSLSE